MRNVPQLSRLGIIEKENLKGPPIHVVLFYL